MKAINIDWDIDNETDVVLPNEIEIPNGMTDEDEISDYITNETGFCHYGFELDREKEMAFEEANAKVQEWFDSIQDKFLRSLPIWARLGVLSNKVANAHAHGCTDEDIDWDKINNYLTTNVDPYDFNCFDKITSSDELFRVNSHARTASILGAWHKGTCKDCGKTFYMTYDEVCFFEKKELPLPKRCKPCRMVRKGRR
jgi:hypothetical protein